MIHNISPAVARGEPLDMLFLVVQLLAYLDPSIEDGAVEVLADHLVADEPLAVVALSVQLALLPLQAIQLFFFLQKCLHLLVLTSLANHTVRHSLASLAGL